jgi:hypothetical protein
MILNHHQHTGCNACVADLRKRRFRCAEIATEDVSANCQAVDLFQPETYSTGELLDR